MIVKKAINLEEIEYTEIELGIDYKCPKCGTQTTSWLQEAEKGNQQALIICGHCESMGDNFCYIVPIKILKAEIEIELHIEEIEETDDIR